MEIDLIHKNLADVAKLTVKIPIIDENTSKQKLDAKGNPLFELRTPSIYIRLDNEHGIEGNISEFFWDDANKRVIWFESPTRGNVSTIPMSGISSVATPVMVSCADYDQIQQMSFHPTRPQFEQYLDTLISSGIITADKKPLLIKHWFNRTDQNWLIDQKDNKVQIQDQKFGAYEWPDGAKPKD